MNLLQAHILAFGWPVPLANYFWAFFSRLLSNCTNFSPIWLRNQWMRFCIVSFGERNTLPQTHTHTLTISRTLVFTSRRPLLGSHPPDRRRGKDAGVDNNVYECTSKALDQLERDGEAHGSAEAQQQSVSQLTVRSVYMRSVLTVIVVVTCSANANGAGLTAATDRAGHLW
jgi:hypothetical protein